MKGLILLNAGATSEAYFYQPKRLSEEFAKIGVKVDIRRNINYEYIISNGNVVARSNEKIDFVVFMDKDKYILPMIEKLGIPVFNNSQAVTNCDDKMLTHIALSNNNIPMPKTFPGMLRTDCDAQALDILENGLGYPLIAKNSYGSLGKRVYLIRNREELSKIASELKSVPHLFQEYIESSYGKDIRVIVIGDHVIGAMVRESHGDFRSNIGAGGSGRPFEIDEKLRNLSLKVKNILGLDYCGIDVLFGKDGPIICEVNSNAFFKEFEHVTGINVAKQYVEYIVGKTLSFSKNAQ